MSTTFTKAELERYARHLILPEFGMEGQQKLKASKVLVVGTGGLGAPMLQYLTAAGVGHIGIIDFDVVDDSNLQRQVLFTTKDVGQPKVAVAVNRLQAQNPHIQFTTYNERLTSENALSIIQDYDLVADGTDNFPTRYLVNDACVLLGKPNVYAAIFRFEGQVSVFNYQPANGLLGPNYRDIFPEPPPPGSVPSCAEGGVLGVLPGIIGSLQANEVIKVLTGIGQPLSGKLFIFDTLSFTTRTLEFERDPDNPLNGTNPTITELINYEQFCGLSPASEKEELTNNITAQTNSMKTISVKELKQKMDNHEDFQLIDVREPHEAEICEIGGELIPLGTIMSNIDKISRDKEVIIHCRSGGRSGQAVQALEAHHGFTNLYNLTGGILAWADEIDHAMAKY